MDFFSQIEGLSGENLGSALFQYLIFNSHEVRDEFIDLLSDESPIGPLSYSSHFSCRTEYPTTCENFGSGKLDIIIQLDDVVIGIENKFFAQFQSGQPQKYYPSLLNVAESLKSINHTDTKAVLYVLCPESRKAEASEKIIGVKNVGIITWEQVIECLSRIENISNNIADVVRNEFVSYLKRHFSFVHDFERKASHLRRAFPDYGTTLQWEVVAKLWSLVPSPGGRLSKGKTWLGYYFYENSKIKEKGWIGFVSKNEIMDDVSNEAELIIATTYDPVLGDSFDEIELRTANFIGAPGKTNAWIVRFDKGWDNIDTWRDCLQPLWSAVPDDMT